MDGLESSRLVELFNELDAELGGQDEPIGLLCVGGAAISLRWGNRYTNDVDIVSDNITPNLRSAVEHVAKRNGLPSDWLNDGAKGFAPDIDPNPSQVFTGRNLIIYTADARYLLAMKLFGARSNDTEDIMLLMRQAGLTNKDDLLRLVEISYPSAILELKTQYMIEESVNKYTDAAA